MRKLKVCLLLGAAAIAGFTGCKTYHTGASGDRSEGRMVDDKNITAQVKSDLEHEPVYKFDDVQVKTFNGIVQLSGFVHTEGQKRRAGEVAQSISGVTQVQNAIALTSENPTPTGRNEERNRQ
jgi:hyperosmotically inducible protein